MIFETRKRIVFVFEIAPKIDWDDAARPAKMIMWLNRIANDARKLDEVIKDRVHYEYEYGSLVSDDPESRDGLESVVPLGTRYVFRKL